LWLIFWDGAAALSVDIDWQSLVFQSGWLQKLDKLAAKRFGEGGLAEEAGTYVVDKLSADNWKCLATFKGQCKPESYLHTVTSNYLEAFSRHRFGRLRPPQWLKRQGSLWIQIWKMICLERQLVQSVIENLCSHGSRETLIVKEAIRTIKAKLPWCGGESHREITQSSIESDQDNYLNSESIELNHSPEVDITESTYVETLLLISSLMNDDPHEAMFGDRASKLANHYLQSNKLKFEQLQQKINMTDEEKIILRMFFQDGLNKSLIAKSLGLQEHIPGRVIKKILSNIASVLNELKININEISELCVQFSE
jgi:hypothetical protein